MNAPIPTESVEQCRFVEWFRLQFHGVRIYAVPNGGHRNKAVAAKLKAEGVSPGVPDLHIPAWRLWVEMKRRKGGVLSDQQKDWIAYLRSIGDTVLIGNGSSEAREMVMEFVKERGLG